MGKTLARLGSVKIFPPPALSYWLLRHTFIVIEYMGKQVEVASLLVELSGFCRYMHVSADAYIFYVTAFFPL